MTSKDINRKFICIANRESPELAAVISSYLNISGYFPLFEFPFVSTVDREKTNDEVDNNSLSVMRAQRFATFVNNVCAHIAPIENVILCGLTPEQKSYLDFTRHSNVIDIDNLTEVDFYLSPYFEVDRDILECRSDDLLAGLFTALKKNHILRINQDADLHELSFSKNNGIVIIEDDHSVISIVGCNYAFSVGSDILVTKKLGSRQDVYIQTLISDWQKGNDESYRELSALISSRVGEINFPDYSFATFFTTGLPYSLYIKNIIPCSYVHMHMLADVFIMNNIIFQGVQTYGGACVFSPEFFDDEETSTVAKILENRQFLVKKLLGQNATVHEIEFHLKEFPFELFHICSHGGEIHGDLVEEIFEDKDGAKHKIEYERVLSISNAHKGPEMLKVQIKYFLKRLDGITWGSKEIRELKYPGDMVPDMFNAIRNSPAEKKNILKKDIIVTSSCAIKCSDSNYQAMLHTLASHHSPIIFNNTCSSWFDIAQFFLDSGAKGYIGTLWNISNDSAVAFAIELYSRLFDIPIAEALYLSNNALSNGKYDHIYMFWGLHFTSITQELDKKAARQNVLKQLFFSINHWEYSFKKSKNHKTQQSILDLMRWIATEIRRTFSSKELQDMKEVMQKEIESRRKNS